jgi:hypothetical protein
MYEKNLGLRIPEPTDPVKQATLISVGKEPIDRIHVRSDRYDLLSHDLHFLSGIDEVSPPMCSRLVTR